MAALPSPVTDAIYRSYEAREGSRPRRPYLGASSLGKECRRALWYEFRWALIVRHEGRLLRLFDTGDREEARLKADLRSIGVEVVGEQFAVTFLDGHGSGHLDAVVRGVPGAEATWHLLECKTSNRKRFEQLLKEGPPAEHVAQMQLYMGEAGLARALYLVQCKDDDRLYAERLHYDRDAHQALLAKGRAIVAAEAPPDGVSRDPAFWLCKFCDYSDVCHQGRVPDVSCRTCVHASPGPAGTWTCYRSLDMIDHKCPEHLFIPALVGEPIGGSPEWIEYADWINVGASGFPASEKDHRTSLHHWAGLPLTPEKYEACNGVRPGAAVALALDVFDGAEIVTVTKPQDDEIPF